MQIEGKFKTIYADPPWNERGGGQIIRGAQRHYALMKTAEIAALPVSELRDPQGCHLYLWTTNNFLRDGLEVMDTWGFRYVTMITWAKDKLGLGQYFRGQTEHCLFGVSGSQPYRVYPSGQRAQGSTLLVAPRTQHSRKPYALRTTIEQVSHPPYLELFARQKVSGWTVWGNQSDSNETPLLTQKEHEST